MFPYFWIFVVGYLEPFHSFSTLIITKNWGNNEHIHFGILKLKLRNWLKTPVNHLTNIGIFSAYINLFTQPGWKKPAQCFSVTWDCLFVGPSGTDYNGSRQTEVVNKQEEFLPPRLLLSVYLEQMSWDQASVPFPPHSSAAGRSSEM